MIHLLLLIIYLSFISLGLPDSLLGSAWPSIVPELNVPVSYAGIVSMIIALGTVVSSLQSDRLTRRFGTGLITAASAATTAIALFGFSFSHSFPALCLWAIPYGLGAGSVDASLNNFVAMHYESRHMSWLHCMWGIGAASGPYIMGYVLTLGMRWTAGYRVIGITQTCLTIILFLSLPLWKTVGNNGNEETQVERPPLSLKEIIRLSGAKEVIVCFFCYCALEQTAGLWAGSYLYLFRGCSAEEAALLSGMFFLGITAGRAVSGFLTMKFNDTQMIRLGQIIIAAGIFLLLVPAVKLFAIAGFVLIGLGCAPVYPCLIHSTPDHFGAENSQALIGVQMASAYVGICIAPPCFGLLADRIGTGALPVYLLIILAVMILMHEKLNNITKKQEV